MRSRCLTHAESLCVLLMLEDPQPPPFICIEEPENGLYHKLLELLAQEFRRHAVGRRNAPQIFVTTHQPYLVDALSPEETWVLEKAADGFATISRASDDEVVKAMQGRSTTRRSQRLLGSAADAL